MIIKSNSIKHSEIILIHTTDNSRSVIRKRLYISLILIIVVTFLLLSLVRTVNAGNFVVKTGYYVGSGVSGLTVSGLGFQPNYVMIKSSTAAGAAVFKTSSMPANTIAFTSATANDTGTNITLNSDGFSVGTLANVNTANVLYYYVAVGGSDCSATGNFCVGSYSGNGVSPRNITVGFQPTMTLVKRSANTTAANFRVASEPANESLYFTTTARDTGGNLIRSFGATIFTVGATNNAAGETYYYISFKDTVGSFAQGPYAGDGADNRNITGVGFVPNFVTVKNATSNVAASRNPLMNFTESYGDSSSYIGSATANLVNGVQALQTDGFQIGTSNLANQNGATIYWYAIGGADPPSAGTGSFVMSTGNYTGTGASNPISGLGFKPDLVIIKANTAPLGVFRTKTMQGNTTAYLSAATANFAAGITSLDIDGFTVGTAAQTNTGGTIYQWQAFGNSQDPYDNDGTTDFMVGTYYGNGLAGRPISPLSWGPNMVAIKNTAATAAGAWRPSSLTGDNTLNFGGTATAGLIIQSIDANGFTVGTNAAANTAANLYHYFAFKDGSNFKQGSYTGSGLPQSITTAGIRAENVWIKATTAVNAVQRSVSLSGVSQYFVATANVADRIVDFVKGGFRVGGNQAETNTNGTTYYYATWNNPNFGTLGLDIVDANGQPVGLPSASFSNAAFSFECSLASGSLGSSSQKIRISNITSSPSWTASIAATDGLNALWRNVGDTERYDYNDPNGTPPGCGDSADSDTVAGQLTINPSAATNTPELGCSNTGVSLGSQAAFNSGIINAVELVSASSGANSDCIWDITNIGLQQRIPAEQPLGNYTIGLTITVIAN